ncbi:carboxymuconolactone decarboxylase family protein [Kitasatospora sp. NPDC006697]|uniref:carboxymuconolactone decarboxylase family protein n=1 Tax=Kitasatospora sp. NPDC006697 TaxID=3364020 RepID=UPI0036B3677D
MTTFEPRLNLPKLSAESYRTMLALNSTTEKGALAAGLELPLLELVRIRASQINGCAFCLDMHTKDARHAGETEQRIHTLPAWRETPFYTEAERAALELTEAVTLIADGHVPDAVYESVAKVLTDEQIAALTWVIVVINGFNRIAITQRTEVGTYVPGTH